MNDIKTISHDLAIAKLYGSNLSIEETVKTYRKYEKEFLDYFKSEPVEPCMAEAVNMSAFGL